MRGSRVVVVIGAAVAMGLLSAKVLFDGSALNVVPWGILAFATAFLASSRREAWLYGGLFGFVVSYGFLWFDNTDPNRWSKVAVLIPLIVVPALFGALCGFLAAWLGWMALRAVGLRKGAVK